MKHSFESTRLGDCDSCGELLPLNEYSLCCQCDEEGAAFKIAAGKAKMEGKDPYRAGKAAQADIAAKYSKGSYEYHQGFLDCADFINFHPKLSEVVKAEVLLAISKDVILHRQLLNPATPGVVEEWNRLEKDKSSFMAVKSGDAVQFIDGSAS